MQADKVIGNYAIGGAVGANFYLEPAATEDVDVFAALAPKPGGDLVTIPQVYDYARAHGWPLQGQYIVIGGWPVQFLEPKKGSVVEEAIKRAVVHDLDGTSVRVFSPEYLLAIAVELRRPKDKFRAQQFLEESAQPESKFKINEPVLSDILTRHNLQETWAKFKKQMELANE